MGIEDKPENYPKRTASTPPAEDVGRQNHSNMASRNPSPGISPPRTTQSTPASNRSGELRKGRERRGRSTSPVPPPSRPGAFSVGPNNSITSLAAGPAPPSSGIISDKMRTVSEKTGVRRSPQRSTAVVERRRRPRISPRRSPNRSLNNSQFLTVSSLKNSPPVNPPPFASRSHSPVPPSKTISGMTAATTDSEEDDSNDSMNKKRLANISNTKTPKIPSYEKVQNTNVDTERMAAKMVNHRPVPQMAKHDPNFPDDDPIDLLIHPTQQQYASTVPPSQPGMQARNSKIYGKGKGATDHISSSSGRASSSTPGASHRSWGEDLSSKTLQEKSQQHLIQMSQSPSGTGLLPTLEAVRVPSTRELPPSMPPENVTVATAEKDSCWVYYKRSRWAQIGSVFGCLVVLALIVALAIVFSGNSSPSVEKVEERDSSQEFIFFDQLGPHINGQVTNGRFGSSISLNKDGTRMAIADTKNVYLYKWDESSSPADWVFVTLIQAPENAALDLSASNNDNDATLVESDIVRSTVVVDCSDDGRTVAIGWPYSTSYDGSTPAIGRIEIYQEQEQDDDEIQPIWNQVGNTVYGQNTQDYFGAAIALGKDGDRVAVGAPGNGGTAEVYSLLNDIIWVHVGNRIELNESLSVRSVAFKEDMVAVAGQPTSAEDPVARVFQFGGDGSEDWIELGDSFYGNGDNTAYLVELSTDGKIVALSNLYTEPWEGELNDALDVRVFEWDGGYEWKQLGENLHALAPGEKSGYFISLSDDGTLMGMGDPGRRSEDGGGVAGHIHIFKYKEDENLWKQIGPNRDGESPGDQFGYALSISGDGQHLVASSPFNRGEGTELGRVYAFDLANIDQVATQEGWGGG